MVPGVVTVASSVFSGIVIGSTGGGSTGVGGEGSVAVLLAGAVIVVYGLLALLSGCVCDDGPAASAPSRQKM